MMDYYDNYENWRSEIAWSMESEEDARRVFEMRQRIKALPPPMEQTGRETDDVFKEYVALCKSLRGAARLLHSVAHRAWPRAGIDTGEIWL